MAYFEVFVVVVVDDDDDDDDDILQIVHITNSFIF
jgi:hypothetical protein